MTLHKVSLLEFFFLLCKICYLKYVCTVILRRCAFLYDLLLILHDFLLKRSAERYLLWTSLISVKQSILKIQQPPAPLPGHFHWEDPSLAEVWIDWAAVSCQPVRSLFIIIQKKMPNRSFHIFPLKSSPAPLCLSWSINPDLGPVCITHLGNNLFPINLSTVSYFKGLQTALKLVEGRFFFPTPHMFSIPLEVSGENKSGTSRWFFENFLNTIQRLWVLPKYLNNLYPGNIVHSPGEIYIE